MGTTTVLLCCHDDGSPPFKNTVDITVVAYTTSARPDNNKPEYIKYIKRGKQQKSNNTHRHPHGRPGRGVDEGRADEELLGLNEE